MKDEAIDSILFDTWRELQSRQLLVQLGIIVGCFLLAWLVTLLLRKSLHAKARRYVDINPERNRKILKTRFEDLHRMLLPLVAWVFLSVAYHVMMNTHQPAHVIRILAILTIASVLIDLGLYTLRRVFKPSPGMLLIERWFGIVAWIIVALKVTGFFPAVVAALSGPEATFTFGKNFELSAWQVLSAVVWIAITLIAALGLGSLLESRLMRSDSLDPSIRIVLARLGNAVLVVVAILVAMRLVDIDITVLSVFGGALGVGLGLGLQRIASNYVSGFIILLDRSLRIGDVITVDKYNGSVTQIRTRCTVVRTPSGVEALVPNELLLNQAVQNFSNGDTNGSAATSIRVAYDTDIDEAIRIMLAAAGAQSRILADPASVATLKEFGTDGILLELTFWVADPGNGTDVLRSDVNRAIWAAFKKAAIEVPFPRRDVTLHADGPPKPTGAGT
jgi:small-conductance mechanosensitive channel